MKPIKTTFNSVKIGDIEVASSETTVKELVKVMNKLVKKHQSTPDYQHEEIWG